MANEYGLTEMQEHFCREYVNDPKGNATAAAIRAGYGEAGAAVEASKNLRKPKIISRIKDLRNAALRESGYDKEKVRELIMRRLTGIVSTHVTDIINISPDRHDPNRGHILEELAEQAGGQRILDFGETLIVPTTALTEEASGAIKKIKVIQATKEADSGIELELNDVIAAAKLLAEISGIKDAETNVNINLFNEIDSARSRSGISNDTA